MKPALNWALTHQNDRLKDRVARLADTLDGAIALPCDASDDGQIQAVFEQVGAEFGEISFLVHSIAFANREDLAGRFADTGREGFRLALDVSAYTLIPLVKHAAPLMANGGSVIAMTFDASQKVYPGYNVMGTAKAALEHSVRQLAAEFGPDNVRVNAISAGPIDTLAARGIHGFLDMKKAHAEKAPLQRKHRRRRGRQDRPLPVQRPLQRHHRLHHPRGRRLPHHGRLSNQAAKQPLILSPSKDHPDGRRSG